MATPYDIHPYTAAAEKAIQAGNLHTEITVSLGNFAQAEQGINNSRAAAIYSFNNANLLYSLAAKDFRDLN